MKETQPLLGASRQDYHYHISCWLRYKKAWIIAGTTVLFIIFTAVLAISQWKALDAGVPMTCSKGGIIGVLGEYFGELQVHDKPSDEPEKTPFALTFSGNGQHATLLHETKTYLFSNKWWRTVWALRDENGYQTKYGEDGMPTPRWKAVSMVKDNSSIILFGGHALSASPMQEGSSDTKRLQDDPENADFANDVWILQYEGDSSEHVKKSAAESQPKWKYVHFHEDEPVPLPRRAHAAASVGDKMYVFGGKYCNLASAEKDCKELGDLWVLDVSKMEWKKLWAEDDFEIRTEMHKIKNPDGRHGHTLVAARVMEKHSDEEVDYLVLYGGRDSDGYFNDVWAWNTVEGHWEDWTPNYEHTPLPYPPRRDHHMAASVDYYEDENPKMVIFGGRGAPKSEESQHDTSSVLGDLWEFDFVKRAWHQIHPEGIRPMGRFLSSFTDYNAYVEVEGKHGGTTIEKTKRMLIFGGDANIEGSAQSGPKRLNDMWEYNTRSQEWRILSRNNC